MTPAHADYDPAAEHLLAPAVRRDPYPYFRYLREQVPVLWVDELDAYLVARYDDVARLAKSPQLFSSIAMRRQSGSGDGEARGVKSVITVDPPEHGRLRGILQDEFRMRPLRELAPRIDALVDELLAALETRPDFDLVSEFSVPLPVTVIGELLDIDESRREDFKHWSDCLIKILNDREGPEWEMARAGVFELIDYFAGVFDARSNDFEQRHDILSVLLRAEREGNIDRREMIAYANLLLTGGNETTTNLIGGLVIALKQNPDQLEVLVDQPSLIPNAIEEGLRYCSPVQGVYRRAMQDTDVAGTTIPAGKDVVLLLGSANHDESRFAEPERFDVARRTGGHTGFGIGVHHCLGAHLGRLETRAAMARLIPKLGSATLKDPEIAWNPNWFVRGPDTLRLAWA
ncbi:MAG: cytochrome P450 [Gammaproteobacteria bacterium]